jgi:hypothetical protein
MINEPVNLDPSLVVVEDLACADCGYNLRTLSWSARCPECGRPVSDSRPLAGFRFSERWVAGRLRAALVLLVVAVLLPVLANIWYTFTLRYFFQLPSRAWQWPALYAWFHVSTVAAILRLVAAALIWQPLRGTSIAPDSRLPRATLVAAGLAAILHLAHSKTTRPFGSVGSGWIAGLLSDLGPFAAVTSLVSILLLWLCLLKPLDRTASRTIWLAGALSAGLLFLAYGNSILALIYVLGTQITGLTSWPSGPEPWWTWGLYVWESWHRYVNAPCNILVLVVVWAYLRKLSKSLRLQRAATG